MSIYSAHSHDLTPVTTGVSHTRSIHLGASREPIKTPWGEREGFSVLCGADMRHGATYTKRATGEVTCKRCLKMQAAG